VVRKRFLNMCGEQKQLAIGSQGYLYLYLYFINLPLDLHRHGSSHNIYM
jgi:hypothetical protein